MPGKISGDRAGRRPQQSLARGVSSVAVIAWLATVMTPAAEAQGIRQDPMRQASIGLTTNLHLDKLYATSRLLTEITGVAVAPNGDHVYITDFRANAVAKIACAEL